MTDRIDRFVRGELPPEEARALAQAALDSPALFDELTGAALAKAALNPRTVRSASVIRAWRRTAVIAGGLAAAAALVLIALPHRTSMREANVRPVLELSTQAGQPVLLATGLHPANAPVFRGSGGAESHSPQSIGEIVSMEDGRANLSLGSLDGLAQGSELQVFRGAQPVGRLQVTTVFRDRARASVMEGKLRPNDEVRVGGADHLSALLQEVDAAFNRGDRDTATKLAEEGVRWGESAAVPPSAMAVAWNQLAVLHMLRGEYGGAGSLLLRAASAAPKTDPLYSQFENNLGVLAELRGERDQAAARYQDALNANPADQRPTVERNLTRVQGSR